MPSRRARSIAVALELLQMTTRTSASICPDLQESMIVWRFVPPWEDRTPMASFLLDTLYPGNSGQLEELIGGGLGFHDQFVHLQLNGDWILAGETTHAEVLFGAAHRPDQTINAQVSQRVGVHEFPDVLHGLV